MNCNGFFTIKFYSQLTSIVSLLNSSTYRTILPSIFLLTINFCTLKFYSQLTWIETWTACTVPDVPESNDAHTNTLPASCRDIWSVKSDAEVFSLLFGSVFSLLFGWVFSLLFGLFFILVLASVILILFAAVFLLVFASVLLLLFGWVFSLSFGSVFSMLSFCHKSRFNEEPILSTRKGSAVELLSNGEYFSLPRRFDCNSNSVYWISISRFTECDFFLLARIESALLYLTLLGISVVVVESPRNEWEWL